MKYRITHPDKYNWCLEGYEEGGELISRGRYVGQEKKARWVTLSYHGNPMAAAKSMLHQAMGDAMLAGEAEGILEALTLAEERVLASLSEPVSAETGSEKECQECHEPLGGRHMGTCGKRTPGAETVMQEDCGDEDENEE